MGIFLCQFPTCCTLQQLPTLIIQAFRETAYIQPFKDRKATLYSLSYIMLVEGFNDLKLVIRTWEKLLIEKGIIILLLKNYSGVYRRHSVARETKVWVFQTLEVLAA